MNIARHAIRLSSSPWLRLVALLGLAALALISLVPAEQSPPRTGLPGEIEHFIAYACVSALGAFAFQHTARMRHLAAAFVVYAAVLEFFQLWSPGRSASLMDFLGSSAGALVGIVTCMILLHRLARIGRQLRLDFLATGSNAWSRAREHSGLKVVAAPALGRCTEMGETHGDHQ